jgi:hypothetical protein
VEETILRVIIGGTVVSTFALLGDVLKPRSFAGLFGAAPSVALATLAVVRPWEASDRSMPRIMGEFTLFRRRGKRLQGGSVPPYLLFPATFSEHF